MDERVGASITFVLGEIEPGRSACHRDKPRKAWLELMLPFLAEPEALVPGNSPRRILDVQNRHDLLVHASEVNARVLGQPAYPGQRGARHSAASAPVLWEAVALFDPRDLCVAFFRRLLEAGTSGLRPASFASERLLLSLNQGNGCQCNGLAAGTGFAFKRSLPAESHRRTMSSSDSWSAIG
jgi:hypothetical protein